MREPLIGRINSEQHSSNESRSSLVKRASILDRSSWLASCPPLRRAPTSNEVAPLRQLVRNCSDSSDRTFDSSVLSSAEQPESRSALVGDTMRKSPHIQSPPARLEVDIARNSRLKKSGCKTCCHCTILTRSVLLLRPNLNCLTSCLRDVANSTY